MLIIVGLLNPFNNKCLLRETAKFYAPKVTIIEQTGF